MTEEKYWKRGEITRLSIEAKINKTTLSNILHRRVGVSKNRAFMLESLCRELFDKDISWREWMFNASSEHEAFFDKPQARK